MISGLKVVSMVALADDDNPPYHMAVSRQPPMKRGYIEFLCGGTPTPVGASKIFRFDELKKVLLDFLERAGGVTRCCGGP
jgi:hypothetical protein